MNRDQIREIEPALLSNEENQFLIDNIGKSPVVALKAATPEGVNPNAVRPILARIVELMELEKHEGETWVGLDMIKAGLKVYLEDRARAEAVAQRVAKKHRNMALFPTLYVFDGKGKPHFSAPGSDVSYQRTYFDPATKQRRLLAIPLVPVEDEWVPPWLEGMREAPKDLLEEPDKNRFECRICNHAESYKADSKASLNAARARMSKHLKSTSIEPDLHREYYVNVFGS